MMVNNIQPLPVTPQINATESLMSLILRTSAVNGYTSPSFMLRHAGMTENEIRSARPPIDKLAALYARNSDYFCLFSCGSDLTNRKNKQWSVLGQSIPAMYVNVKSAKICPECTKKDNKIDGFWDLKYAIACPEHKRYAITICPNCRKPLRWLRQGLLTCSCGHDLSELKGDLVEDESILSILSLIKDKLHGGQLKNSNFYKFGYPLEDLRNISFSSLISIISRLHKSHQNKFFSKESVHQSSEKHTLKLAGGMLSNWPQGFYDYLENLYAQNPRPEKSSIFQQFRSFHGSYFEAGLPPEDVWFLKEAFFKFGNERWKNRGLANPREVSKLNITRNFVGINEVAKYLGVTVVTVIKYERKGLIKGETLRTKKSIRRSFDLSKLPFKKSEGKYYKLRDAAKFIGLPVSLLSCLRKQNIYKVMRLGWGTEGFSEIDLVEFRDTCLAKASTPIDLISKKCISVKQLLRKKISPEKFSKIIVSINSGELIPIGRLGDNISDIVLEESDALKILALDT